MRLAQIARKVNVKPAEIRKFIKDEFKVELEGDPNTKLEEDQVNAILEAFKTEEEEKVKKPEKEKTPEEEIPIDPEIETDIESLKELAEEEAPAEPIEIPEVNQEEDKSENESVKADTSDKEAEDKKVVTIKYEEEAEDPAEQEEDPSTFEEVEVDPDAELIAAKVEKLEGLKVVGKIDLMGPPPKEEELPSIDAIEDEIDALDGELDTSEFPDLTEDSSDDEKEAIFAELDAQMDAGQGRKSVKKVQKEADEVLENVGEEEYSIYKNSKGQYRWTSEQKENRAQSLAEKAEKQRIQAQKEKKKRHYQENVAAVSKPKPKKTKKSSQKRSKKKAEQKAEPKGLWQKFKQWLNDD